MVPQQHPGHNDAIRRAQSRLYVRVECHRWTVELQTATGTISHELFRSFEEPYRTVEYHHGGTLVLNIDLGSETALDGRKLSQEERKKIARDCTLAAALIRGADKTRFGTLQTNLENQYCNGKDEYPTDLTSAYGMLATYRMPSNAPRPSPALYTSRSNDDNSVHTQSTAPTSESSGITFAQRSATSTPGTNGVLHEGVTCYRCNGVRHYSCDCPAYQDATTSAATLLQHGLNFGPRPNGN